MIREDYRGGEYAQGVICLYEYVTEKPIQTAQITYTN